MSGARHFGSRKSDVSMHAMPPKQQCNLFLLPVCFFYLMDSLFCKGYNSRREAFEDGRVQTMLGVWGWQKIKQAWFISPCKCVFWSCCVSRSFNTKVQQTPVLPSAKTDCVWGCGGVGMCLWLSHTFQIGIYSTWDCTGFKHDKPTESQLQAFCLRFNCILID